MASEQATGGRSGTGLATDSLTGLHWLGIVLSAITGVIHLRLGAGFAPSPLGISFLFAGVVFLGAIAAIVLDVRRRLLYILGIPFTAGQIPLWLALNWPNFGTIGIVDKVAQVALIGVLVVLYRRSG